MLRLRALLVCAGGMLSLSAAAVTAAPPVMDRVPDNAFAVIGISSADTMHKDLTALMTAIEFSFPLPEVNDMLAMAGITGGIDTAKSAAIVLYPPKKDAAKPAAKPADEMGKDGANDADEPVKPEPRGVVLLPITKYDDLLANFGVKPGAPGGIEHVTMPEGEEGFVKDLGGGYVAMSDDKELLTSFEAKTGASPLKSKLGKAGDQVADSSDIFIVVNMDQIRPMWPEAKAEMEKQIKERAAGIPMGDAANPLENPAFTWFMDTLVKESAAFVGGVKIGGKGFGVDFAANFTEGSTMGAMFNKGGNTRDMWNKLPAAPYLIAAAIDFSSAEFKRFFLDLAAKSAKPGEEPMFGGETLAACDGMAVSVGLPKGGLLGGILTGAVSYIKCKDPGAFITANKAAMAKMNGKSVGGVTMTSTYTEKAVKVDDVDVDAWEMKVSADEGGPGVQQSLAMIYGPTGGPGGYIVRTDGGVYQTFAKSSELMSSALKTGKGGDNLGGDKLTTQVAGNLPSNRIGEVYIGTRSVIDMVLPFATMMGVQVPAEKIPETLPPIALSLSGQAGSAHFAFFVPTPVIKAAVDVGMAVQQQMEGGDPGEAPAGGKTETGQPRF